MHTFKKIPKRVIFTKFNNYVPEFTNYLLHVEFSSQTVSLKYLLKKQHLLFYSLILLSPTAICKQ